MDTYEEHLAKKDVGRVLVVDDVASTRALHRLMLSKTFEVQAVASGDEALSACAEKMPDLVLLDVEMPGLNGFDTCRKLRETSDIPIIFATGHDSHEEHLKAYDAGGTDICVKPVSAEILIRKVSLAIDQHRERARLREERESLMSMAEQIHASLGDRGTLLRFTRTSLACNSHAQLARNFVETTQEMGIQCCIAIRHDNTETTWSANGEVTALERSVLGQLANLGKQIQFKTRLGINCESVSVVVSNMPDEGSNEAARIRDSVNLLVETTEALTENISQRQASAMPTLAVLAEDELPATVEDLRNRHRNLVTHIQLQLQELIDNIEASFDRLATDKHQEIVINAALHDPVARILQALKKESLSDQRFERLLNSLRSRSGSSPR